MTIFKLAVRQILSGRRWIVVCLLAAVPALLALLETLRASGHDASGFLSGTFADLGMGLVVPLVALLLAGSAFGGDVEDGTAIFILAKPVSRMRIVFEKMAATITVAVAIVLTGTLAAILIARPDAPTLAMNLRGFGVAVTAGTAVYCSLFLALSLVTRRGVMIGLLYIVIWEGALSAQFAGTRALSVKQYMLTIANTASGATPIVAITDLTGTAAVTMVLIITLLSSLLAWRRLNNFELSDGG